MPQPQTPDAETPEADNPQAHTREAPTRTTRTPTSDMPTAPMPAIREPGAREPGAREPGVREPEVPPVRVAPPTPTERTARTRAAPDVHSAGDRVERLLADLGGLSDAATRAKAEDLVRTLLDLYGAGLEQVMGIVVESGADEVLHRLTADHLVAGLLVLHDLHPLTTAERVRAALDEVRPYLGLHEGGVELSDITPDGVVRLRLQGSCHGCPSSQITVTQAVERAVIEAAPEISRVEVEGVAEPARPLLQIGPRPPGPCPVPEEAVT